MKTIAEIASPDEVELTLTITMKASQWQDVVRQLKEQAYPGFRLSRQVHEVMGQLLERVGTRSDEVDE